MGLSNLRTRSVWHLDASPADVFEVLGDIGSYQYWWPEVKSSVRVDDETLDLRCRSALPFGLTVRVMHSMRDQQAGLLRVEITGDLEGHAAWELVGRGGGTDVLFEQDVQITKPWLRRLLVVMKPFVRGNHELMMRGGLKGLQDYLASVQSPR